MTGAVPLFFQPGPIVLQCVQKTAVNTFTTPMQPSKGSMLFVCCAGSNLIFCNGVSDNIDGVTGWSNITNISTGAGGSDKTMQFYYKKIAPTGITGIQTSFGSSTAATTIIHEIANVSWNSPLSLGGGTQAPSGGAQANTPSQTNTTANAIFFAPLVTDSSANPTTMTINAGGTTGGTWKLFNSNASQLDGSTYPVVSVPYIIVNTSTSCAHYWTTTSTGFGSYIMNFHL